MANTFNKGDKIVNIIAGHKIFAVVKDTKIEGSLVVYNKRFGNWIADPDKCEMWTR